MVRRPGSCDTPVRPRTGRPHVVSTSTSATDGASRRAEQHEHEPDHEDDDADRDEDRDVGQPPDEQQDDSQDDHGCLQVLAGFGWNRKRPQQPSTPPTNRAAEDRTHSARGRNHRPGGVRIRSCSDPDRQPTHGEHMDTPLPDLAGPHADERRARRPEPILYASDSFDEIYYRHRHDGGEGRRRLRPRQHHAARPRRPRQDRRVHRRRRAHHRQARAAPSGGTLLRRDRRGCARSSRTTWPTPRPSGRRSPSRSSARRRCGPRPGSGSSPATRRSARSTCSPTGSGGIERALGRPGHPPGRLRLRRGGRRCTASRRPEPSPPACRATARSARPSAC